MAYVLHDLFAVSFDQVAAVLDTNPTAAKKLASRARIRLREAQPAAPDHGTEHVEIVEAFLVAAQGGDIARLITLLALDAVRTADLALLPTATQTVVRGATTVAEETKAFIDRIATAVPVLVDGLPGAVIAPGGHALALIRFQLRGGKITRIDIAPWKPATVSLIATD